MFCGWPSVLWSVALLYLYFENQMLSSPCLTIDNLIPLGWFVKMMTRCAVKNNTVVIGCEPHVTAIKHNAKRRQF